ncbi:MAG: DUF4974 domain-containing protein [Prolixibacteraceae bacterium]|jgi:ferric-dicitrate binding protein FerR (iron transport regulator)|nr:DUF4974 domain-containing protein [Prolixibacteraceae bacterium]
MIPEGKQIEQILTNSILGHISNNEKKQLEEWTASSPEHQKEAEAYRQIWEKSKKLVYSEEINIKESLAKTKKRIPAFRRKKWIGYLRQAAAVLLLTISFTGLIRYYTENTANEITGCMEVKTAYGMQTSFSLPDGTEVWLNSGSILRYPKSFRNKDTRSIELKGEGYFNVTKDPGRPFIVKTSEIDIKVLGTEFNVTAYDDFRSFTVALEEGKVSILKNTANKNRELLTLNPGEVAEYNRKENKFYHFRENSLEKYTAWKKGMIMFYGDPIETVIHKLEKWYNVEIRLADKNLTRYRFTATFENESLDQVLNLLSISTPLKYETIPAEKKPDHSFSKRVIIISNK